MKAIISASLFLTLILFLFHLKLDKGVYEYRNGAFYESIELRKDFKFNYNYNFHFISYSVKGNYRINGDSLILDSSPQRDKIIVREDKKGNRNNIKFNIKDKLDNSINYTLYAITENKDTIVLKNQWNKSKIKNEKIDSFYLIDTKGLKTPIYKIKGGRTNYFEVQMETNRVLDNEFWQINDGMIIPKGMDGKNQTYVLKKR